MIEYVCRVPAGYECYFNEVVPEVPTDWWQVFYIVTAFFTAAAVLALGVAFVAKKIDGMR